MTTESYLNGSFPNYRPNYQLQTSTGGKVAANIASALAPRLNRSVKQSGLSEV